MKKNKIRKLTAQTKRNQREVFKAKRRTKSHKQVQYVKVWEPGPSAAIAYDANGKVKGFIKYYGKHQKNYVTEQGKAAMEENKRIRVAKKNLITDILKKAGYDPTIRYTRSEKKKFTRVVKKELVKLFETRRSQSIYGQKNIQPQYSVAELNVKEKTDDRVFKYVVQRKKSDNSQQYYDFLTDYLHADTLENAKIQLKGIAKKFEKDSSFSGVSITDSKDNSKMFYSRGILLDAA